MFSSMVYTSHVAPVVIPKTSPPSCTLVLCLTRRRHSLMVWRVRRVATPLQDQSSMCTRRVNVQIRGKHMGAHQRPTSPGDAVTEPSAAFDGRESRSRRFFGLFQPLKRALTTSPRDRWNRRDVVCPKQYAQEYRRRFQGVNDVFHGAGKGGKTASLEGVTLQFRGVEWSYMIFPAALAMFVVVAIDIARRNRRPEELAALCQQVEKWSRSRERNQKA
uniref:Transmembrane protein n=1 Tax=Trypanosoma congolense (strain IL3000) TaxID=1068625 RepID=G0URI8_TRYCI|nr:conserved hypothetical protein [Trypanosoma congolense IL3000]